MSYKPHTNPVRSELLENSLVLDGVSTNEPSQASLVAQLVKKSACYAGDPGSIPGSGRSPGGGHGNPLQYSCLDIALFFSKIFFPFQHTVQFTHIFSLLLSPSYRIETPKAYMVDN